MQPSQPPGWYHAQGDPVGTQRYWDGELWQGEPVPLPPTQPQQSYGGYMHYPENSQATMALVLSICGLLLCGLLGPVGWKIANDELKGIDAGRRDPSNRGNANAARIIGIIVTVLLGLAFAFIIVAVVIGASSA